MYWLHWIFVTFPLIHPDQVYPNSTNIRSIGMVIKDQVIKWDHLTGYMTLKGTETVFTSRTCCHETHNYVVCTCNTLQPFSPNDSKLISVESLHGHSNAIQVSHTQWCVISEMNSFTYGGLTCPADHSFCLEVTEDFSMGQIDILGRMPKDAEVSPWWDDTFYEHGTQALIDTMDLVQNVVLQTEYHLSQAQVETNLARKTAQILSSIYPIGTDCIYLVGLGTSRLRSWKRTHLLLHAISMLLFPTPHQISKSIHQHYPNPQPLKAARLTTTEVTLQGTLGVAQTVPKGETVSPGPVPKCLGPPREELWAWCQ